MNVRGSSGLVAKSCLTLVTPWTVALQAPQYVGFPRQEHWSGLPFSSPGDLPNPGLNSCLLHWLEESLLLSHPGSPARMYMHVHMCVYLYLYMPVYSNIFIEGNKEFSYNGSHWGY